MIPATSTRSEETTNQGRGKRLAAVLFADIVNYSGQVERDETANSLQAAKSVELFRSLVGDYGGEVATVAGDGVLALFDSAERALRFAIQVQSEFRDQAVWSDGAPMQFRVGLNLGEVVENHGIVQGHCVNVASRLQQLAEPGTIVASGAVRDALRGQTTLRFTALGRPQLKNISEAVEAFLVNQTSGSDLGKMARAKPAEFESWRQPSVAVLALQNLSNDPASDHLCEGIVEDVIANLTRFRNLAVIARHSSFQFRVGQVSPSEIGRQLGVQYLLTGSLRRSERRFRIGVQLVDSASQGVIWSDHFNAEREELFDLQDEITSAVASRLAVQIDLAERHSKVHRPKDFRAYGLVLRGQQLVAGYKRESNLHGRRLFEEARDLAPDYGRVHSALSRTHNLDWRYSWSDAPEQSLETAVEMARTAILHDPLDARGYSELGFASLYKKRHDEALANYLRALTMNPNDADIIAEYADALVYAGQSEQSVELLQRAMRLNPYFPDWYLWYLADAHFTLGRHNEVIQTVLRMQNPDEGRRLLAASYAHLGRLEEARKEAQAVLRLHPAFTLSAWRQRPPYQDAAVLESFVSGLRTAGLPD